MDITLSNEDCDRIMQYATQYRIPWERRVAPLKDDYWKKDFKWFDDPYIRSLLELEKEDERKRRKAKPIKPLKTLPPESPTLTAVEWLHDKMDELRNAPYSPHGITFEEKSIIMAELSGLIKLFKGDV